jgi:FtsP/CotA-like multicopper oxidase with cupredoxin domain
LLVEGFASQFPGLGDIAQKLLVLKDWGIPGCAGAVLNTELHCRVISINGEPAWHDTMPAMGSQLWRISNEGANLTLHLAAPGLHFRVIGRDGTPALDGQTPQTLDIMPASRLDVLVTAATQGAITLMATGVPTGGPGHFSTSRPFGTIAVTPARATAGTAHVTLPREPDLRGVAVDRQRLIIFGENAAATIFTINGQSYSPANQPFRVPLGSTEAWTIRNDTQDFHVFHIHQLGFQVLEINGRPQAFTGYVDGVRVPETGEVKLLMPFTSKLILGHIMFHCHVLKHEDAGMMAELELFRPGGFKIGRTPTPPNHPPQ